MFVRTQANGENSSPVVEPSAQKSHQNLSDPRALVLARESSSGHSESDSQLPSSMVLSLGGAGVSPWGVQRSTMRCGAALPGAGLESRGARERESSGGCGSRAVVHGAGRTAVFTAPL